eukprot:5975532-Pyramimonas_sp.AAC.1
MPSTDNMDACMWRIRRRDRSGSERSAKSANRTGTVADVTRGSGRCHRCAHDCDCDCDCDCAHPVAVCLLKGGAPVNGPNGGLQAALGPQGVHLLRQSDGLLHHVRCQLAVGYLHRARAHRRRRAHSGALLLCEDPVIQGRSLVGDVGRVTSMP